MKRFIAIILICCCVFWCCACDMDSVEYDNSQETAKIPFSHDYVYDKHYSEIEEHLKELGFSNIEYDVSEMNYDLEENFDGRVVGVYFDGEWEFEKGDRFALDTPIIISYVVDKSIAVPKASALCEGLPYEEVTKLFVDAGFLNVTARPVHPDDTDGLVNGSVRFVWIEGVDNFSEDATFDPNSIIEIYYNEILPSDSSNQNTNVTMVWISETGSKYHSNQFCSDMDNPAEVSKDRAEKMGYTPCKKCH